MTATVMRLSELAEADSLLPTDYLADSGPSCRLCGLTPSSRTVRLAGRSIPLYVSRAILETERRPAWVVKADTYRCRNRLACDRRRDLTARPVEELAR